MKIKVEFTVKLPSIGKTVSHEDISEWIEFNIGARGGISLKNPLIDEELEADPLSVDWQQERENNAHGKNTRSERL